MMFTLFVLEHNAVCDALKRAYPGWTDEELYQRARLVISALIAKIHTAEWTPAIIAHPTTVAALHANWWGVAGQKIRQTFGRISNSEVISGIPGSATDQFGVPYSLTEEFSIVYRMHPLIPDDYTFRSVADDSRTRAAHVPRHRRARRPCRSTGKLALADLFYSFGIAYPGALVLNNYPRFLQEFQRPDNDKLMDLAGHGYPAHPRARRAPLQRVPPPAPPQASPVVRGPGRRQGDRGEAAAASMAATSSGSTRSSACSPRRSPRASGFPTPRSASSS